MAQTTQINFRIDEDKLSANLFYSESNMKYLEQIMKDIETGKAHFAEHELLEEEEYSEDCLL